MSRTALIAAGLVLLLAAPAAADWLEDLDAWTPPPQPAPAVDWTTGVVRASASAGADPRRVLNRAHARSQALRTARTLAHEKLAETVDGIQVDAVTTLRDERLASSRVETRVQARIRGARVVREDCESLEDGSLSCEVELALLLGSEDGLVSALREPQPDWELGWDDDEDEPEADEPARPASPPPSTTAPEPPAPARAESIEPPAHEASAAVEPPAEAAVATPPETAPAATASRPASSIVERPRRGERRSGLIVDARGLGFEPALFPRLLTTGGEVVFSFDTVRRKHAVRKGLVEYARDWDAARNFKRVGRRPLVVRALAAEGEAATDLILSDDAAPLISATVGQRRLGRRCRVVILLDEDTP